MPARFRVKIARHATEKPFKVRDRERPAFLGQYATLGRAMLAIDNVIRRERGMPERVPITADEIRELMEKRRSNLLAGKVPHAAPVRPIAPHSARCACTVEPILPAEYVEEGINR
jgi:hypothetical protein